MYYTGFADEAAMDLAGQIRATKELGWDCIESRRIDGVNIHDLSEEAFDKVCEELAASGVRINCFGSEVANWQRDVFKEDDYYKSIEQLARAIRRMKRLGCDMIRGMSFKAKWALPAFDPEVEKQVFRKVKMLVRICEDAGVYYMHENCNNYGGQSPKHTLKLLEAIDSPNFKLIFDTGNPVMNYDRQFGDTLERMQNAWDFYSQVREFVAYVHIKDGVCTQPNPDGFGKTTYTFPGEGDGCVVRIVEDLIARGYDGGFSMEPHLKKVFHDAEVKSDEEQRYDAYVEYGRRFMKIVDAAVAKRDAAKK